VGKSHFWKGLVGIWKNIVIGIVTDGTVEVSGLSELEEMGVFWNGADYGMPSVNHKDILGHLYEVCRMSYVVASPKSFDNILT
jgi:hypothetical protein